MLLLKKKKRIYIENRKVKSLVVKRDTKWTTLYLDIIDWFTFGKLPSGEN